MKIQSTKSRPALAAGLILSLTAPFALVACDRETSTHKESTSKVVDTPEGKKKVTETTETTTTHDPK